MIGHLRGRLLRAGAEQVVVDVNGVGYKVTVPASTRSRLPAVGKEVSLHTFLQVREDALTLFGFLEEDEYDLFELMQRVDGVGPRLALAVLSSVNPEGFRRAVLFEDITSLTRIPGVGKKTAQRMVLELKDKLGSLKAEDVLPAVAAPAGEPLGDAIEALVGLGYSRLEAVQALESVRKEHGEQWSLEQWVRLGLRALAVR